MTYPCMYNKGLCAGGMVGVGVEKRVGLGFEGWCRVCVYAWGFGRVDGKAMVDGEGAEVGA